MNKAHEKARYLVTRNVFAFMFISMVILSTINLIIGGSNILTSAFAASVSGILLLILIKKRSIFPLALIGTILAFGLNSYNLTRASNFENYIDLFWLINLSLFAYFTLGKWIGHIYLAINIISVYTISVLVKLDLFQLKPASNVYNFNTYLDLFINISICTIFFGYLVTQFLKQTNKAKDDSIKSNIELQKQYDEKSIMLKEIHHRVKNNLQVITSLLRLQMYNLDEKENSAPFSESIDRISSMALIHEKMYQGDTVKNIDLKEYIEDLAKGLLSNYANEKKIDLCVSSIVQPIELNHIVPLSLILNELLSNSLKHAFKTSENGEIEIAISVNNSTQLTINYNDNGNWVEQTNNSSFGIELIDTFTEQLNGDYTLTKEKGTKYCFIFKDIIIRN